MKDKIKIEKEKYYYRRDQKGVPLITVCLVSSNGSTARGVALCSMSDQSSKEKGRKIALERARKALYSKRNWFPINALYVFRKTGMTFEDVTPFKCEYNPSLTSLEQKIMEK